MILFIGNYYERDNLEKQLRELKDQGASNL
jgi:hypothetical protein